MKTSEILMLAIGGVFLLFLLKQSSAASQASAAGAYGNSWGGILSGAGGLLGGLGNSGLFCSFGGGCC